MREEDEAPRALLTEGRLRAGKWQKVHIRNREREEDPQIVEALWTNGLSGISSEEGTVLDSFFKGFRVYLKQVRHKS